MGGNSSRAVFCGVINQLLQTEVPSTHHEFWDEVIISLLLLLLNITITNIDSYGRVHYLLKIYLS